MYKNQLQELAQRSCFNLPAYTCIREGPDHAPRFKAVVHFNGENFESPAFCTALRQAEHAAAEVALTALSKQGPSRSLAAKVLDETGVYKNLLQETSHRAGLNLPVYTTVRSGPGHTPVFTCIVELAGLSFTGEPAKTKKQAQKNAALAAWSALKQLSHLELPSSSLLSSSSPLQNPEINECQHQDQVIVARALAKLRSLDNIKTSNNHGGGGGRGRKTTTTIYDEMCPTSNTTPPPFQSWPSSTNLLPDVEMYKLWHHQEHSPPRKQTHLPSSPVVPTIRSSQPSPQYLTDRVNSLSLFFSGYSSAGLLPGLLQSQPTHNESNNNSRKDVSEGLFPDHLSNNNSRNDGGCRNRQWMKHSRPSEPSVQSHSTAMSAQGKFRMNRVDSFLASPVNIRTAIPVCSARPAGRSSYSNFQSTPLAPAVRVRPVTSAPPPPATLATTTGKEE